MLLEGFGPEIWTVEGRIVALLGFPYLTRMAHRSPFGSKVVHGVSDDSPMRSDPKLMRSARSPRLSHPTSCIISGSANGWTPTRTRDCALHLGFAGSGATLSSTVTFAASPSRTGRTTSARRPSPATSFSLEIVFLH